MLLSGSLPNIKKVVDMYVDKVIIHKDKVELVFKFHPDLTPPRDDKRCGAADLYASSGKSKKHTGLTQTLDNPCVLRGGEGGTRTLWLTINPINPFTMVS
jgi:hypothetical protein